MKVDKLNEPQSFLPGALLRAHESVERDVWRLCASIASKRREASILGSYLNLKVKRHPRFRQSSNPGTLLRSLLGQPPPEVQEIIKPGNSVRNSA